MQCICIYLSSLKKGKDITNYKHWVYIIQCKYIMYACSTFLKTLILSSVQRYSDPRQNGQSIGHFYGYSASSEITHLILQMV